MPVDGSVLGRVDMNAFAREAHLIRTRNRIAYWQERLKGELTTNERNLIEADLLKHQEQLMDMPEGPASQPTMLQNLQLEVKALKEMLSSLLSTVKGKAQEPAQDAPEANAQA